MPKQNKLKSILAEKKMTIKALAKECGIKEGTLYKKMSGVMDFTYTEVYEICKALGIENPVEVFIAKE